jgi:hypothetical protein
MISYLIQRSVQKYWTVRALSAHRLQSGFYLVGAPGNSSGVVVFDLSEPKFVHLGDQLFFEPAMQRLKDLGVSFAVIPTKPMSSYFASKGFVVAQTGELGTDEIRLRITPLALYDASVSGVRTLVVDLTDTGIRLPLGAALTKAITEALVLPTDQAEMRSSNVGIALSSSKIALPPKSVVFSNYVDSGRFRIRRSYFKQLEAKAVELRSAGHSIVHVGSNADKLTDSMQYRFVDLDLRGRTSAVDIIDIFLRPEVVTAVTFDNFVMHAALMASKPVLVKFRGRFTKSAIDHHIKHVNPALAPPGSDLITYL